MPLQSVCCHSGLPRFTTASLAPFQSLSKNEMKCRLKCHLDAKGVEQEEENEEKKKIKEDAEGGEQEEEDEEKKKIKEDAKGGEQEEEEKGVRGEGEG